MSLKLITYDVNYPVQEYRYLLEKIKSFPNWRQISKSCHVIETEDNVYLIYKFLSQVLREGDALYVIEVDHWTGQGPQKNWMHRHNSPF